jgi:hypothetical protein
MGLIVDPDSPDEIFRGLSKLVQLVKSGQAPRPNWEIIRQFEVRKLTGQLAQVLEKVVV